jgi:hypothetical protein
MPIFEIAKSAGSVGVLLLVFGGAGLLSSTLAVAFALSRKRAAFAVGIVSLALAALIAFGGALGTVYGRRSTDAEIAGGAVLKVRAERMRRRGYDASKSASKLGLIFAVAPLFAGAVAAFAGARRRKEDRPTGPYASPGATPEPEGDARLAPGVLVGIDLLGVAGAAALLLAPLPGRDWADDDPTWTLAETVEEALTPATPRGLSGPTIPEDPPPPLLPPCMRLEGLLERTDSPQARRADVPDLPKAARHCYHENYFTSCFPPGTRAEWRAYLQGSLRSGLLLSEEDRRDVRDMVAQMEDPEVMPSGRLPTEVVKRVVEQRRGDVALCYRGSKKDPALEGQVKVRFVIDRDGAVSQADGKESSIADSAVVSCVVSVVSGLSFPQPEGGAATVVFPFWCDSRVGYGCDFRRSRPMSPILDARPLD